MTTRREFLSIGKVATIGCLAAGFGVFSKIYWDLMNPSLYEFTSLSAAKDKLKSPPSNPAEQFSRYSISGNVKKKEVKGDSVYITLTDGQSDLEIFLNEKCIFSDDSFPYSEPERYRFTRGGAVMARVGQTEIGDLVRITTGPGCYSEKLDVCGVIDYINISFEKRLIDEFNRKA